MGTEPSPVARNAGTGSKRPALDMSYEEWRSVVAVDLDDAFQAAGPLRADAGAKVEAVSPESFASLTTFRLRSTPLRSSI